jgi:hypothetical protein
MVDPIRSIRIYLLLRALKSITYSVVYSIPDMYDKRSSYNALGLGYGNASMVQVPAHRETD